MTLAARCPSCATAFRVVQDQLRVADGWVRCGRCEALFDAQATLFVIAVPTAAPAMPPDAKGDTSGTTGADVPVGDHDHDHARAETAADLAASVGAGDGSDGAVSLGVVSAVVTDAGGSAVEAPPATSADQAAATVAIVGPPQSASAADASPGDAASDPPPAAFIPATGVTTLAAEPVPVVSTAGEPLVAAHAVPAADVSPVGDAGQVHGGAESDLSPEASDTDPPWTPPLGSAARAGADADADSVRGTDAAAVALLAEPPADVGPLHSEAVHVPAPDDIPSFVRDAERRERRDSRPARNALAASALVLLALLALQAAWRFRDTIAVRWPAARPALDALCGVAGCRIEPPRRIGDVAVDSSALTRAPAGQALQLALVLRNRGSHAVAVPWVELTLTDAGGRLLTRRALAPADLRAPSPALIPGTDTPLRTELGFEGTPPAGYTLEIFYP